MSETHVFTKYAILCVDDEEYSLKYFRKICAKTFRILTATDGDEALRIVAKQGDAIGVVMTDERMPRRTGVEVLSSIRESHPGIVRMLTTAYSDLDSAIRAVNSGAIHKYVVKPWDVRDLEALMKWALRYFEIQKDRDVLVRERLSLLRHFVVADRIKSLAVLAAGLSHHVRNSMVALKTFLDLVPTHLLAADAGPIDPDGLPARLYPLAVRESQRILEITQKVADATVAPSYRFAEEVPLRDLLCEATERLCESASARGIRLTCTIADDCGTHKTGSGMLRRMFEVLLRRLVRVIADGTRIEVAATNGTSVHGAVASRVLIRSSGPGLDHEEVESFFTPFAPSRADPSELGLDLLAAYFICYHHGGEIRVHQEPPVGPGFEVLVPRDPTAVERLPIEANTLAALLTRFDEAIPPDGYTRGFRP